MHGKILPKHFVLVGKTSRTVPDQKHFCYIFMMFYWNKCVSINILICARINSTKTLCFDRKKTARTVLDQKCFCNIFIKFYWNKCAPKFWSIFYYVHGNILPIQSVSFQIYHKVLLQPMCFSQYFNVHM